MMETSPMAHMPGRREDVVRGSDLPADAPKGTPAKRLRTSHDIECFVASPAHAELKSFLWHWAASVQLVPRSAVHPSPREFDAALPEFDVAGNNIGRPVHIVWDMFRTLRQWMEEIPLEDMQKARFGNPAYRVWHERLTKRANEFLEPLVALRPSASESEKRPSDAECVAELRGYLLDSFGNATRIDYGSGHELHFALILFVLRKMGVLTREVCFAQAESDGAKLPSDNALMRQLVHILFWGYIDLMRDVQRHFRMEPAGSHGVWGLDDFHHIPFVIGAAQLHGGSSPVDGSAGSGDSESSASQSQSQSHGSGQVSLEGSMTSSSLRRIPPTEIPPPSTIVEQATVDRMRGDFIYFEMIGWIRDHKRGPFHEHSSVLYNVSGLDNWGRIANGMMKMFDGEVLQKINIVQHLLFGHHFPFDPSAAPARHHHAATAMPRPAAGTGAPMTRHPGAAAMAPTAFPGKGVPPPTVAPGAMPPMTRMPGKAPSA